MGWWREEGWKERGMEKLGNCEWEMEDLLDLPAPVGPLGIAAV